MFYNLHQTNLKLRYDLDIGVLTRINVGNKYVPRAAGVGKPG